MKATNILLGIALLTGGIGTGFHLGKNWEYQEEPQKLLGRTPTIIKSETGCCRISIDHPAKLITYETTYGGKDVEPYTDKEDMDAIINQMQEHCYYEHYYEY